jgi:hypothetical protein
MPRIARPAPYRGFLRAAVLAFVIALATLAGATEQLLRKHVVPVDLFRRHVEFVESERRSDAAFGDSHIARGFPGTSTIANLAFLSESIEQIDAKVRYYYRERAPGRVILLGAPHLFRADAESSSRDYARIFSTTDSAGVSLYLFDPYYRVRVPRYWFTWLRHGGSFPSALTLAPHGGLLSDATILDPGTRHRLEAVRRVAGHRPAPAFERSSAARRYESLVALLVERGAKLCIVTMPTSLAYREYAAADPRFAAALAFVESVGRRHGAAYVSYWSRFDDLALFADVDHLNRSGAELLAPELERDCFAKGR